MIEFALILPIILLIVLGTLDIGRIVFLKAQLENATREGARVGRVATAQPTFTVPNMEAAVEAKVKEQTGLSTATVATNCAPASCAYQSILTVTATLPVSIVVGLVPALPSLTINASASVRIE
jgi:Flp pilus assembly protein TadG